jgi:hypothetical protein
MTDYPVIARSEATKQSRASYAALDCFATLAMTAEVTGQSITTKENP